MAPRTQARIARFMVGGTEPVDAELFVRATDLKPDDLDRYSFVLTVTGPGATAHSAKVQLRLIGEHQVADATAAATAALAAVPGIAATGAWLSGTGLAQVVPHAKAEAERIRHTLLWD